MEEVNNHKGKIVPSTSESHSVPEVDNGNGTLRHQEAKSLSKERGDIEKAKSDNRKASNREEQSEDFDFTDFDLSQCIAVFPGQHDIESFDASRVAQESCNGEKPIDREEETPPEVSLPQHPTHSGCREGEIDLSECLAVFPGVDCENQEIDLLECLAVFPGGDYLESRDPSVSRSQDTYDSVAKDGFTHQLGSQHTESNYNPGDQHPVFIHPRRRLRERSPGHPLPSLDIKIPHRYNPFARTDPGWRSPHPLPSLDIKIPHRYNPFARTNPGRRSPRASSNLLPKAPDEDQLSPDTSSIAEQNWRRRKQEFCEESVSLDRLMALVGLEQVKSEFLRIKSTIDAARSRKGVLTQKFLNVALSGNPGTGMRTVAGLYSDFLQECGIWDRDREFKFHHWSGFSLAEDSDISHLKRLVNTGFLFITNSDGIKPKCRANLFKVLEGLPERVVVVIAGSIDGTAHLLSAAPEGAWLFPRHLQLSNYDDEQLRRILIRIISNNSMTVQSGLYGPYPHILARQIGRRRDGTRFGNIHELEQEFEKVLERQAARVQEVRARNSSKEDQVSDDHFLTMEDIIGPEPEDIRSRSAAWRELQKMAGLEDVKNVIGELLSRAKVNYHREIRGMKPVEATLNRVFLGPPGTGKTTVATLYGQILVDIGLLSTQEVVHKTPADFIGRHLGESEFKTNQIINSTRGKVLIIDDAHMFYHGTGSGTLSESDKFRLVCIDVLVSKIHSKPKEDRCVILIGYPEMMEEMFRKCNPGLRRRFPLEEAFRFADYDDQRLNEILALKMEVEGIAATESAIEIAAEVLRRARDRPNFGNGGDVENLVNRARINHRRRISTTAEGSDSSVCDATKGSAAIPSSKDALDPCDLIGTTDKTLPITLEPEDFDPEYDRGSQVNENRCHLFDGLLGFDGIVQIFERYQRAAANLRLASKDPRESIPFTYVFKGPPGTGKTHTAQIVGQIFYNMGFLSTSEVIECSATHLVGEYKGHTGPKVINLFERALGKVLFIDEAYRLGLRGNSPGGSFMDEAIGELVDCMTKPRYFRKMIIVLAGYDREMDALMKVNTGLCGRFPVNIHFPSLSPKRCFEHLRRLIEKEGIEMQDERSQSKTEAETVLRLFEKLSMTRGWANGRDIRTLAGTITIEIYGNAERMEMRGNGKPIISSNMLIGFLKNMLRERIKAGAV